MQILLEGGLDERDLERARFMNRQTGELVRVMPRLGTAATDNSILARVQAVEPRKTPDGREVSHCTLVPERPLAARES